MQQVYILTIIVDVVLIQTTELSGSIAGTQ